MKDEIKNLKVGCGSTVCSEASTGMGVGSGTVTRPPPLTSRWSETFIPIKMEFKGWVTDYFQSCLQGITDDEVTKLLIDLEKLVPQQAQNGLIRTKRRRNKDLGRGKLS